GHSDLLAMLMEATDEETGERMSDKQLRDEAMTIFVAGHETTANNLAWTFYLLSKHPAARRKLYEELASVLGGRSPTVEDLPRLEWTRWVIQESMRLYPPAWITGRNTVEDDVVGGWFAPRGSLMFVSPMLVHRHPDFWDDPEGFDPERFSPSRSAGRPTYAYFPFGGGPRQCIGNGFAMMEAQLLLATIAQHIELDLLPGAQVTPEPVVTLRPRHGLPMRVLPRG
ncbi:MAG: cytochrome P450, partial [Polyangiales bacterium]